MFTRKISHRALAPSLRVVVRPIVPVRCLHNTDLRYKKKVISSHDEDGFNVEEDDLFATPIESEAPVKTEVTSSGPSHQVAKLSVKRAASFRKAKEVLMEHPVYRAVVELRDRNSGKDIRRIVGQGHKPVNPSKWGHPPARAKLTRLIALAGNRAELLEIVEVLRIYRAKRWPVDDLNRIDFIGRCVTLRAPDIALAVLHHRPIFGIDIPSLNAARALMRSLLVTPHPPPGTDQAPLPKDIALPTSTPFTNALLLANLFDIYALPPIEKDPVTRALLLGGCVEQFKSGGDVEDANTIVGRIREWAENRNILGDADSISLGGKGPAIQNGKLVATSRALKIRGKGAPDAPLPEGVSLDWRKLTLAERKWVEPRLKMFTEWAENESQDASWLDKLNSPA